MSSGYPPFRGLRRPLDEAARGGGGRVAGWLTHDGDGWRLRDATAELSLRAVDCDRAVSGAWVSGELRLAADGGRSLGDVTVHALRCGDSPDPQLPGRLPLLRLRADIDAAARAFFRDRGFLDVATPARVRCPGLEPHLRAFPAGDERWLITSPELHLKRLLAAGAERIVEFARAFRADERGPWHLPEFTMVEWYRAFAGLDALMDDCEGLVAACAAVPGVDVARALPGCDVTSPFARTTVRQALRRRTGLDLATLQDRNALAEAVEAKGHDTQPGDDWNDLFFRVWIAEVEPFLGVDRPEFVTDWPGTQAALARTRREAWGDVAERFELYIGGIELANAFDELNDPVEQRHRHEADRAARAAAGVTAYPLDENFLAALTAGMPPAAGIALGLDRLIATLLGQPTLTPLTPFP